MKVSKEMLKKMKAWYLEGNSIRKIAKLVKEKYGIRLGKETVRRYLSTLIKLRSKKEVMTMKRGTFLDEKAIIRLYTKEKLSLKQIAQKFKASPSGIKWLLLKNRVKLRKKLEGLRLRIGKYKKPPFNGSKEERAYLIGLVLGDLAVRENSRFTLEVNTSTTHEAMIKLLVKTFSKHTDGIVWYLDDKKGFRFYAYLDKSFEFLLKAKRDVKIIDKFDGKEFLAFLAGFFDAEGCIVKTTRKAKLRYEVKIGNTKREILEIIRKKLEKLEINSKIFLYKRKGEYNFYNGRKIAYKKPYFVLEIKRKHDMVKFLKKVPISHLEKLERKREAIDFLTKVESH